MLRLITAKGLKRAKFKCVLNACHIISFNKALIINYVTG